ncbi:hypothetical protein KR018_010312, partial [Drosophila ironensis]
MEPGEDVTVQQLLQEKFPCLEAEIKEDGSCIIRGILKVQENLRRLNLFLPQYPSLQGFRLYMQENLVYKQYTADNLKVEDAWKLEDLLANLPSEESPPAPIKAPYAGNLFSDIMALNKSSEYTLQMDQGCSRVRFCEFVDFEQHYLELKVVPWLQLLGHSLPDCVPLGQMLEKSAHNLADVLNLFLKVLEDLRPFYDNFLDIDELCHVLQPHPVTTKHNSRVFPLRDRVYLKVTIADPFACVASMELKIVGPTAEVSHLRHVLSEGLGNWDPELDLHKNLLRTFDLCFFPMPDWTEKQADAEEDDPELRCNICFSYRLEGGEVPLVSCDNAKCVLKCHAACLEQWFKTQLEGKTFLEVSFGQCPFCKAVSTSHNLFCTP